MQNPSTRPLVYAVAMSLDHYIAHEDESMGGFLTEGQHINDYLKSLADYDAVLMGRRTYEWGYQYGVEPGQAPPLYSHMTNYVFSQSIQLTCAANLHLVTAEPASFVAKLKQQPGKAIYLCGGGQLAGFLLNHKLVDELIIKLNPVVFGRGIAVFGSLQNSYGLTLLDTKVYSNGAVFLHYQVRYQ
jgi:dihydrofolate reductase